MPEQDNLPLVEADLAVVGFGKGGKTLAAALAKARKRVVMIEQSEQMYGGTCINSWGRASGPPRTGSRCPP